MKRINKKYILIRWEIKKINADGKGVSSNLVKK